MVNYFLSQNSPFTVLDIGSGKICCLIAKLDKQNKINILGAGFQESKGIVSGSITDMKKLESSIRDCLASAEKMASIRVKDIILGFSSVSSSSEVFSIEIDLKGSIIGKADLEKSYEYLYNKLNLENRTILHVIPVQFSIDGNKGIKDPLGMYGNKLGLEVSIISTDTNILRNFKSLIKKCDLEVRDIIFSAYSLGHSVLTEEEKDLGTAVVDIGAELTSVSIFLYGELVFTNTIPIGGNLVTKDISKIFSLALSDSERIKIINGQLIEELENSLSIIEVGTLGGENFNDSTEITRRELISVIKPRIIEIIDSINDKIKNSGYDHIIANRLVITGGVSQTDGLIELIQNISNKKARLARAKIINNIPENMRNSSFSVINSLLHFTVSENNDIKINKKSINLNSQGLYNNFLKFKNWFYENF